MRPVPRSRAQRKADTLAVLRTEVDCWVVGADAMGSSKSSRSPLGRRGARARDAAEGVGRISSVSGLRAFDDR